jgi:hypothetical protein
MSAADDRDDYILQETLNGKSARAIGKQLRCTTGEINSTLDRVLPQIDNEARMRHIVLDLQRLEQLLAVFLKRAIEDKDQPSGMLCVKILERKAALLGLDQPTKLDVVQVHVEKKPDSFDQIHRAIWKVARGDQPMPKDGDGSE